MFFLLFENHYLNPFQNLNPFGITLCILFISECMPKHTSLGTAFLFATLRYKLDQIFSDN